MPGALGVFFPRYNVAHQKLRSALIFFTPNTRKFAFGSSISYFLVLTGLTRGIK